VAVLAADATFEEFRSYTCSLRGAVSDSELADLWIWRQKLQGIRFDVGRGYRDQLPPDEQHLTNNEREAKVYTEAKSQGRSIEKLPERSPYWI
jgi:hypothetical protein